MNVAIIPARGGSKRIPKKNIRLFNGKPIIAYSIEVALASGLFDRVIVSTDDDEIAAISRQYGAQTPFIRDAKLSDDYTGTNAVIRDAIVQLIKMGEEIDYVCCIYATAPLLQEKYLRAGYEQLCKTDKLFAFSVTAFPFPIQRAIKIMADGSIAPFDPTMIEMRSQDLEEAYHDAGQFYWGKSEAYLANLSIFSGDSLPIILPQHLVQDIDTLDDWAQAELKYLFRGAKV